MSWGLCTNPSLMELPSHGASGASSPPATMVRTVPETLLFAPCKAAAHLGCGEVAPDALMGREPHRGGKPGLCAWDSQLWESLAIAAPPRWARRSPAVCNAWTCDPVTPARCTSDLHASLTLGCRADISYPRGAVGSRCYCKAMLVDAGGARDNTEQMPAPRCAADTQHLHWCICTLAFHPWLKLLRIQRSDGGSLHITHLLRRETGMKTGCIRASQHHEDGFSPGHVTYVAGEIPILPSLE